jgi:hypothetical protein
MRTSLSEIRSTGRATQGVTIFKLELGDSVASIACVGDLKGLGAADGHPEPSTNGKGDGELPPSTELKA